DKALKDCASLIETCSSDAAVMIACARGCSDNCSAEAAKDRTSSRLPSFAHTEVNFGFPSVRVPVLSTTIVSTKRKTWNASPERLNMTCSAAYQLARTIASGVAMPGAHGLPITNTPKTAKPARTQSGSPANNHEPRDQAKPPVAARVNTVGTYIFQIRSTNRRIPGFMTRASATCRATL